MGSGSLQKKALCWTNDKGEHIDFTFADIKRESDKTASYSNHWVSDTETWLCSF